MHSPKETAERRLVGDEFQRLVRLRRRRDIGKSQGHTRDDLHNERQQSCAAKHVPPARVVWHKMFQARPDQIRNPESIVNPSPRPDDEPFHNVLVIGMAIVLISTWPFTVRTS